MKNKTVILSLICNLLIVGMEIAALIMSWSQHGTSLFTFYTEDSNLLSLVACIIYSVCLIRTLKKGDAVPAWASTFKYVSACCLTLTFLVVVCVLAPMIGGVNGYKAMLFSGSMLFTHFLCPLLSIASFLFLDPARMSEVRSAALYAMIPTALYAAVTIVLNLCRKMDGPYPFLKVYEQPWWASILWCIAIIGGAYCIARLLLAARKQMERLVVQKARR